MGIFSNIGNMVDGMEMYKKNAVLLSKDDITAHKNSNGYDTKIIKFRSTVQEIHDYLCRGAYSSERRFAEQNTFGFPFKYWKGEKTNHVKYIYIPSFLEEAMQTNRYLSEMRDIIVTHGEDRAIITTNPEDIIRGFVSCKTKSVYRDNNPNFEIGDYYNLIFWLLFMSAIDDNIYHNNLSDIIDIAHCLKFNEEMISDWCRVIEYILNGNPLNADCDLEFKSKEGYWFFIVL